MPYQVLARKYRPKSFSDVVGQTHVVQALSNALTQNKIHHAYLFTGTRGIGKTTLARIFAKCISCEQGLTPTPCNQCSSCQEIDSGRFPDFYEVDAASRTKVEDTRELLDNVQYSPAKGRFKIYLIDEVHMLSGHSFNALLKTLEEPPEHVKFLLATTDPQKLPATVLSRCLQFHLSQMTSEQTSDHLSFVLEQENIEYEKPALNLLGQAANGSIRDGLSLLDQCIAFGNGKVLSNDVKIMLGSIEPTTLFEILQAIGDRNGEKVLTCVNKLNQSGADFNHALRDLLNILHQISITQVVPNASIEEYATEISQLANNLSAEDVQLFYQIGVVGQRDFNFAPSPKVGFEMCLLRMLAFYPSTEGKTQNKKPATQSISSPQKKAATTANTTQQNSEWHDILPQLSLSGAALALARNLKLESITETHVYFNATPKQKPLLQAKQTERINDALNQYLKRKVMVKFNLNNTSNNLSETKPEIKRTKEESKKEQSISQDPKVQQMVKAFDATLIEKGITTSNEKS